jgi:hypothetical protein
MEVPAALSPTQQRTLRAKALVSALRRSTTDTAQPREESDDADQFR